jgi:DNA-binding HxlR family transcriptional regulator
MGDRAEACTAVEWRGRRYDARAMTEEIVGCKWSMSVLDAVRSGVTRPGEIERHCHGISTKILNERLHKMLAFGIIKRIEYGAKRQHVEYHMTPRGHQFLRVLAEIEALQSTLDAEVQPATSAGGLRVPGSA